MKPTHPLIPQSNSKIVPPPISAPRKESFEEENARLKAENERLRKACELVFNESAKRKFLMCYKGDDFYVSLQAMEAMSEALGYSKAKDGEQP